MGIARDTFTYWLAQMADIAFRLVTTVFIAVHLGPALRGELQGALLANAQALNLTNLGLQTIGLYFTGKFPDRLATLHAAIIAIIAAAVALDAALLCVFGDWLRVHIFGSIPWRYLAPALALLPVSFYVFAGQGMLTGLGRVRQVSRALFYYSAASCAVNMIALMSLADKPETLVLALILIWMTAEATKAAVFFALLRRAGVGLPTVPLPAILREAASMMNYGLRAFVGGFASSLVNRMDQMFILASVGPAGFGVYTIAPRLAEMIFYPSAAFESAGYSRVAGSDRPESTRLIVRMFRSNFLVGLAGAIGLAVVGGPFIHYALGGEYDAAIAPLYIMLPGVLMFSGSRMLALFFSAQMGKPQIPSAIAWVIAFLNVGLLYAFVVRGKGGLVGAAAATSISYAAMLLIYVALFAAVTGLRNVGRFFIPAPEDWALARRFRERLAARFARRP